MRGAAGPTFSARGADRSEAMELVLRRGSRQPEQLSGWLPSRDREGCP